MGSLHKNIQLMLEFLKTSFLVLHFSYYTLMTFLVMLSAMMLLSGDDAICSDDTALYSKYDLASDPWQQLEMATELECDLRDTMEWDKKWLADFNAVKTLFCLTGLITLVLLMWERMCLFLRKNNILRCWGCLSLLIWIGTFTLCLLLKLPPRK